MKPCKSYREDARVCADGFVQKPYCSGNAGCLCCGAISRKQTPYCLREEVPEHMVSGDGYPAFLREAEDNQ